MKSSIVCVCVVSLIVIMAHYTAALPILDESVQNSDIKVNSAMQLISRSLTAYSFQGKYGTFTGGSKNYGSNFGTNCTENSDLEGKYGDFSGGSINYGSNFGNDCRSSGNNWNFSLKYFVLFNSLLISMIN